MHEDARHVRLGRRPEHAVVRIVRQHDVDRRGAEDVGDDPVRCLDVRRDQVFQHLPAWLKSPYPGFCSIFAPTSTGAPAGITLSPANCGRSAYAGLATKRTSCPRRWSTAAIARVGKKSPAAPKLEATTLASFLPYRREGDPTNVRYIERANSAVSRHPRVRQRGHERRALDRIHARS
jgi:hypothetical protein